MSTMKETGLKGIVYLLLLVLKAQLSEAVVRASFERHIVHHTHHYARAFDPVESPLYNIRDIYYMTEIRVGTPGQSLLLMADTGSSDSWVNSISLSYSSGAIYRTWGGFFDCSQSNTCKNETYEQWAISYSKGNAIGNLIKDNWSIDNITINNYEFAAAEQQSGGPGVLGLGYRLNESPNPKTGEKRNDLTFTEWLAESKAIECVAFSVWLNGRDSPSGDILFGAVDLAKFSGEFHIATFISNGQLTTGEPDGIYSSFYIMMKEFNFNSAIGTGTSITMEKPVLIDSGTAFLYLPHDIANAFNVAMNATYDARYDQYYLSTKELQELGNIEFNFGNFSLSIDPQGLFLNAFDQQDSEINGIPIQWSGIKAARGDNAVFGDVFLRNVYVTFDLGNNIAGIAKAKYTNETNIVPLGPDGILGLKSL